MPGDQFVQPLIQTFLLCCGENRWDDVGPPLIIDFLELCFLLPRTILCREVGGVIINQQLLKSLKVDGIIRAAPLRSPQELDHSRLEAETLLGGFSALLCHSVNLEEHYTDRGDLKVLREGLVE